ncbi:MAG: hypothetical protein IJU80_02225, partial [Lachnospiraceae bacterium]|nr:hypothetical protein [Lachnospiraceae bacterium]
MGRYISKYVGRYRLLYAIGLFITCMLLFPVKVRATEEYLAPPEKIGVIQAGQLYPTADYFIPEKHRFLDAGDMIVTNVDEALYQGMRARQTKIDVSAYGLTYSNWGEVWSRTIDNHEDLFYVEWTSGAIGDGTYIKSINVTYDTNYSQEDVEVFYEVCSTILEKMPDGLTAQQKTLYLHDYLVTHCEYDMTFSKFDAYNALVEGSSVCQGYALAYAYLCKRVGVEAYLVTSIENDHAWDLVVLDGTYYYVDCTWDDPVGDWYEAYCRHSNYLRSQEGMVGTNHQNTRLDWTSTVLGNVSQIGMTSTRYDSYYWSDVISAMPFIGTVQAYAMQNDCSNVYLRTNSGTVTKIPIGRTAKWYVWGSTSSFYSSSYISMAAVSNDFYFSTEFAIYKMSADGKIELFYELTAQEKEKGYLFGIVSGKDALVYSVGTKGWNNQDFVKAQLMIGPPMVSIDFDANGGFGTMSGIDIERGSGFEFPACGFTAPEGMVFSGWAVNGTIYAQGASMIVNENLSIQAVWKIFVDTSSPKMVSVTAGESSVTVTWKANVGVPGYVVFRKTDSGRWTKLNEVTGTNYLDATVTAGHTYAYTVRGINDAGKYVTSYDTVGLSVKLEETIDKSSPVILSVTAGNDGVAVTWKANVGVPGYVVFRKTDSGRWTKLNEVTGTNYLDAT